MTNTDFLQLSFDDLLPADDQSPNGQREPKMLPREEAFAVLPSQAEAEIARIRAKTVKHMKHMGVDPILWEGYLEPVERGWVEALRFVLGVAG